MATKVWWHPKKGVDLDQVSRTELLAVRAGLILATSDAIAAAEALKDIEQILRGQGVDLTL